MPIQSRPPTNTAIGLGLPSGSEVGLHQWSPLHVEKRFASGGSERETAQCRCADPKRKKRTRLLLILLILILLYLLADTIFLNVRVLRTSSSTSSTSDADGRSSAGGSSYILSAEQESCLTQFSVNAPTNATGYPCATCLPLLQSIPGNFSSETDNDAQTLLNSVQFCGLQSLFGSSGSTAQTSLAGGGWVKDVKFCAWSGVQCGNDGRVASLQLTFPAVPTAIPSGIGALTGLQTLQIIGDGTVPAGSLPSAFSNLTALTSLHLESTALGALPDALFTSGALSKVTALTLVKNANSGGALPNVGRLALKSLVIDGQPLSTSLSSLLNSSSLPASLTTLSVTSTLLNGTLPASISTYTALAELHLDGTNLQAPLPAAFPPSLQILSLANNSALSGSLPGALCASQKLTSCALTGTGFAQGSKCGVCTF
ncbi:L domain-like protein [Phellopilus nigrolimitatus]|nr:L domain-like protein [Phellopilus nigrolimitatus]